MNEINLILLHNYPAHKSDRSNCIWNIIPQVFVCSSVTHRASTRDSTDMVKKKTTHKNTTLMTSVLSLTGMSDPRSFHKSRQPSKQRLTKWRGWKRVSLKTGAGSVWSPLCWSVGFKATGFGLGLSWPSASQTVSWGNHIHVFLILVTCTRRGLG